VYVIVIGTARIVCGRVSTKRYGVRLSVVSHSSELCCCGPAGRRYRSIAARRTVARQANAGSATLSAYVVTENSLVVGLTDLHTHTRLTALFPGLPRSAGTRKVKPIWILLKQETLSGSGISCAICKSAPRSRQITTPAPPTVRYDVLIFTRAKKVDGRQFNPPHG